MFSLNLDHPAEIATEVGKRNSPSHQPPRQFVNSRPFDVHRWADYPELNDCIEALAIECESVEKRYRRRTREETKGFRNAIRALILDLYVAWKMDPLMQIGVNLNANRFSNGRYSALHLKYRPFKSAFDALAKLGYLTIEKFGYFDPAQSCGKTTKVRATEKLITLLTGEPNLDSARIARAPNEETIILRDAHKEQIDYDDTDQTRSMRDNVARINQALSCHSYDLNIPDGDLARLKAKLAKDKDRKPINLADRTLVRIFNNGSFEEGGRFYGGWWQNVPKEFRRFITINGKATVELDYSAMHPTMLYAKAGTPLSRDPYDIGLDPQHRGHVKKTFNALINAGTRGVAQPLDFDPQVVGMGWAQFQAKIKEAHHVIDADFNSGKGVGLQYLDSQIVENVLLKLAARDIPCLPIHDSFIVCKDDCAILYKTMIEAFKGQVGSNIIIKEVIN